MIDLQAELKQKIQALYEIALDFLSEEEARDLSALSRSAGAQSEGLAEILTLGLLRRPNASGTRASPGWRSNTSSLRQT
jgi:hypothetical protein